MIKVDNPAVNNMRASLSTKTEKRLIPLQFRDHEVSWEATLRGLNMDLSMTSIECQTIYLGVLCFGETPDKNVFVGLVDQNAMEHFKLIAQHRLESVMDMIPDHKIWNHRCDDMLYYDEIIAVAFTASGHIHAFRNTSHQVIDLRISDKPIPVNAEVWSCIDGWELITAGKFNPRYESYKDDVIDWNRSITAVNDDLLSYYIPNTILTVATL